MNEFLLGLANIGIYFAILATIVLFLRKTIKINDEIFRKTLHFILLGSMAIWVFSFNTWWKAVLTCIIFVIAVYPILIFFERFKSYSNVVNERKKGELKSSLVVVFLMFSLVMSICWGIFDDKLLVLASVYSWGVGDALAALIGRKYGKHKITGKFLNGKKSYEGTLTMFISAFISVLIILFIRGNLSVTDLIIISLITAIVTSLIELYTKDGFDTITCPLGGMVSIIILLYLFGGLI